jgi:suppressor for copper-sensitivity B
MRRFILLFFMAVLWQPAHAFALAGEWQRDDDVGARLVSGVEGVGQEKKIPLGLEIELAQGWHTYWRSPGMAGLPPQIDWQDSLSDAGNLQNAVLLYPAPKRYVDYGLETIGYRDHVIFPIDAELRAPGHALTLNASLNLLVCSAVCVPKTFDLKLAVPEGAASEGAEAALIKPFRDQVPGDAEKSGLVLKSIVNDGENLRIEFAARDMLQAPDLFIENDKNTTFKTLATSLTPDRYGVVFKAAPADTLPEGMSLAGMRATLTVVDGDHALEQKVKIPPISEPPPPITPPPLPLGFAVLLAILGGFILNLMPCVLPVLSLKVLSVVSHGGGEARLVRRSFLVTAAGILFSFLVLAATTIAMKAFGHAFGWGVQFQQPVFVVGLILLLTFFAANMWGLFDIHLPRWLADSLAETSYHPKLAGDFAAGAFATLLATPCTAPFLGTAVGFALASGSRDILIIFTALSFGMMLPYLAVAFFPRIATALPKPGPWMAHLRHALGWALAVTALWLLWVLAAQITARLALLAGMMMAGIVVLLALGKTSVSKKLIRVGLIDFAVVAFIVVLSGSFVPKTTPQVDRLWLPFNEHEIAADVDEGKTVFVDVTAAWCLTCKANKRLILSQGDIDQRLFHSDVITMQADWTNPDPVITDFLHKYGRYGIPFNVVFGPSAPRGIVLPELLTHNAVMEALDKAAKPQSLQP